MKIKNLLTTWTTLLVMVSYIPVASADDEAEIRAVIAGYAKSVVAHDAEKASAAFALDSVYMPSGSLPIVGRDNIRTNLAMDVNLLVMMVQDVTVEDDLAYAYTINSGTIKVEDKDLPLSSKSLFVFRRSPAEGWKIHRYIFSLNQIN